MRDGLTVGAVVHASRNASQSILDSQTLTPHIVWSELKHPFLLAPRKGTSAAW